MEIKQISLVIPVYKKEKTIKKELEAIYKTLQQVPYKFEFIVVVDGTIVDKSLQNAKKAKVPNLKVYGYKNNKGKGQAVLYGLNKTSGQVVGFLDSGGDIDPQGVIMLVEHLKWYNADIIIGSKLHSASVVKNYSFFRKCLTYGYYLFVKLMFRMNIRDTQTGLKLFKQKPTKAIVKRMVIKRWAFDMEMLAIATRLGYKIYDAPVHIDFGVGKSLVVSSSLFKSVYQFMVDTFAVWYRMYVLKYYDTGTKREKVYDEDLGMYINTGRLKGGRSWLQKSVDKALKLFKAKKSN